jgi:hypothetical protein
MHGPCKLGCAFPSFSLQHFSPGGGLCRFREAAERQMTTAQIGEDSGSDDCVGTEYCKFCERPQRESGTRGSRGLVPEMRA